jgi:hypothetical protein
MNRLTATAPGRGFGRSPLTAWSPQIHRRSPDAVNELQPLKFDGLFWIADSWHMERFYLCPCGGQLDWVATQWRCRRRGDEWHDEQVRPDAHKKSE